MTDDIDSFIREQKAKLAQERDPTQNNRKQWDTPNKPTAPARRLKTPDDGGALALGGHDDNQRRLRAERHREYNDILAKQAQRPPAKRFIDTPENGGGLPLGDDVNKKRQMQAERQREYNAILHQQPAPQRTHIPTPDDSGLAVGGYEQNRKVLDVARHQEYNRHLEQQLSKANNRRLPTPEETGLPVGKYEEEQRHLRQQRKQEYNSLLDKQFTKPARREFQTPQEETGLPIGQYEEARKKLDQQRKHEYNEIVLANQQPERHGMPTPPYEGELPIGQYEQQQKVLNGERQREYAAHLAQKQNASPGRRNRPETPEESGLPIGKYEQARKQLDVERHNEYNRLLHQKGSTPRHSNPPEPPSAGELSLPLGTLTGTPRRDPPPKQNDMRRNGFKENVPPKPATPEVGMAGKMGQYEDRRKRLQDERKDEYNKLLTEAGVRRTGRTENGGNEYAATLPGLRDQSSAQRDLPPRNRSPLDDRPPPGPPQRGAHDDDLEYQQWLRERQPRRGWATPTYEEILDKKRQEERNYRRHDDPDVYGGGMSLGGSNYMRSSLRDGHLNRNPAEDQRFRDQDREYESNRRVRFRERPIYEGEYDQEDEVNPRSPVHQRSRSQQEREPPRAAPGGSRRSEGPPFQGGLQLGGEVRASADQRKKAAYRQELERQIQETKQNKAKQKQADNVGEGVATMDFGGRANRYPASQPAPRREPARDDFSPREIVFDELHGRRGQAGSKNSILENGFQGLYQPSILMNPAAQGHPAVQGPPAGLGAPPLTSYGNPLEDAYYFYGTRDPLSVYGGGSGQSVAPPPASGGYQPSPSGGGYSQPPPAADSSRFQEPPRGNRPAAKLDSQGPVGMPQEDVRLREREDAKKTYQDELRRQMEEQQHKKQQAKRDQEAYDRKLDEQIRNYDPFGRGGGGAPMRDDKGNIIVNRKQAGAAENTTTTTTDNADLRQMNSDNKDPYSARDPYQTPAPVSSREPPPQPKTDGDHSRGGHGIFGEPMSLAQKTAKERYQDELANQIEEKRLEAKREKDAQRLEDEKLMQKIEEDNRKLQDELEKEKRKEREKFEAAQKQQEEIKREQDERKKEEERKRREEDEKEQQEKRRMIEEERRQRQREDLSGQERHTDSPPIPTMKSKQEQLDIGRTDSPPVPSLRSKTEPPASPPIPAVRTESRQTRVQSANVLNQLARMRQQLQSERVRVEGDLQKQQDEPEVYDPRLYNKPSRQNVDIFEVARNREPVSVRRPPDASPTTVKEFQNLKNKKDTDSRQDFRSMFPESPQGEDALETQQRALLLKQEEELQRLRKDKGGYQPDLRRAPSQTKSLLDADTTFIAVKDQDELPGDYPPRKRNDSARNRRRERAESNLSNYKDPLGSVVSLDPDNINRRNEERLRNLKSLTGDEISTGDPDDILDRFMSKQQHQRPPSGNTLADDTWMRAESGYR